MRSSKTKNQLLIRLLFAGLMIVCIMVFTLLQGYWALWEYRTAPSSGCMDCDFSLDLLFSAALPVFALGILHLLYWWIKPRLFIRTIFCVAILMLCWYMVDTTIFDEREASWSTYSNIWWVGLRLCIFQIITFGVFFGVIYHALCPKST